MTFDRFVGQVQHRARLGSLGEAVRAIRATLESLGERLDPGEAKDLASQLPEEIAYYVHIASALSGGRERFSVEEFFRRVATREQIDLPIAVYHARVVFEVMREAVSAGEMRDVLGELPAEFRTLILSGSAGRMRLKRGEPKSAAKASRSRATEEDKKRAQPLPRIRGMSPAPVIRRAGVRVRRAAKTDAGKKSGGQ
jgi:uncharacterized protein (DUF2267 family)